MYLQYIMMIFPVYVPNTTRRANPPADRYEPELILSSIDKQPGPAANPALVEHIFVGSVHYSFFLSR